MTDVIRRQQKTTSASCILSANYVNARDTAKHEAHQELTSLIPGRFHLCISSVSRFVLDRKVIFQADSIFERGIVFLFPKQLFGQSL